MNRHFGKRTAAALLTVMLVLTGCMGFAAADTLEQSLPEYDRELLGMIYAVNRSVLDDPVTDNWAKTDWYEYDMIRFMLEGVYAPAKMDAETEKAMIQAADQLWLEQFRPLRTDALGHWKLYPLSHEKDGVKRNLCLMRFVFYPGDYSEIYVLLDADSREVLSHSDFRIPHIMEEAIDDMNSAIEFDLEKKTGGDWGFLTIEEKARYAVLYNQSEKWGVPGEGDLPYEKALELAHQALTEAYDTITKEELEKARVCADFYVGETNLYDLEPTLPVYYFGFFIPVEGGNVADDLYEVILDGRTGEVLLTHDPSNSGNG